MHPSTWKGIMDFIENLKLRIVVCILLAVLATSFTIHTANHAARAFAGVTGFSVSDFLVDIFYFFDK